MLALRLWLGSKIFGDSDIRGTRVSRKRMIKRYCDEPELEGLRYIAENTTIPIPRLYRVHSYHGKLALELEYFPGCDTLQVCWRRYSQEQKQAIVDQISGFIAQLRQLEPPPSKSISSADGGPCYDFRVGSLKLFGPFDDLATFHRCVRGGIRMEHAQRAFGNEVMQVHQRKYEICFTHAEISVDRISWSVTPKWLRS